MSVGFQYSSTAENATNKRTTTRVFLTKKNIFKEFKQEAVSVGQDWLVCKGLSFFLFPGAKNASQNDDCEHTILGGAIFCRALTSNGVKIKCLCQEDLHAHFMHERRAF